MKEQIFYVKLAINHAQHVIPQAQTVQLAQM